jgi:hypothetical protein
MAKAIRKLLRLMRGPEINKEVSPVNRRDHKDRGEPADLSVSQLPERTHKLPTRGPDRETQSVVFFGFFVCILFVCVRKIKQIKSNQIKSNQIKSNQIKSNSPMPGESKQRR